MSAWPGNPKAARTFRFGSCHYDPVSGSASLGYFIDQGPEMLEHLVFPHAPWPPEASRQAAFDQALKLLHLVAGVSYYKAALPPEIQFDGAAPGVKQAEFITDLYIQGLAEFSFVNQVDVKDRLHINADESAFPEPHELLLPARALVAMGGGKDSLVGLDLLRRAGMEVMPICVGSSRLIADTVSAAGLPLLRIERSLPPELSALNEAGAWNGHVPVTAINSAILLCAAILYGYRFIAFSNERSADEATLLTDQGVPVNHQYSKTSGFEQALRSIIHSHVSPDIDYFSILRPFSELDVVRRFSAMTNFHAVFSSCNRNFHQGGSRIDGRWCGNCPKCRFAALSLAVFLPPAQVCDIQVADLLNEPQQVEGFREICGLARDKPFECVGEVGESRAALAALAASEAWREHAVVAELAPELQRVEVPALDKLLTPSAQHNIPAVITSALPGEFAA